MGNCILIIIVYTIAAPNIFRQLQKVLTRQYLHHYLNFWALDFMATKNYGQLLF